MDYYGPMLLLNRLSLLLVLVCALGARAQAPEAPDDTAGSSALDSALLYKLLLAEFKARGGDPGSAYALLLDAARKTNDAQLYQRAVDIAVQSHAGESALMAVQAWRQAQPASMEANRYLLQILIGLNRIAETLEPLKREIALTEPKDKAASLLAIPRYFARVSDKGLVLATVEQALSSFLTQPTLAAASWTTLGRLRLEAGDPQAALEAARRGQRADERATPPVALALTLMSSAAPQAEALVTKYLEAPAQPEFRMEYTRLLLSTRRYAEAATQLQILTQESPDYLPAWLVRGALALQDGSVLVAEQSFLRYLEQVQIKTGGANSAETGRGMVQAYLSLAQIAEQRSDFARADAWLQRIDSPEELLNAQLRRAELLTRQGKLDEARQLIQSQAEKSPQDARRKVAAEVQLLRDGKKFREAYELLGQATARDPDNFDLLYERAMLAEKLGNLDEMEQLLRRVVDGQPENPNAYNALGFSLAERNIRLGEARELILKALSFAPGDPFITDSLAWVEYRSGNLPQALELLLSAFKTRPDAEIAAHLGEVLWTMGRQDEARRTWQQGAQLNADNETLRETLKRLRVKL
jgi:tetratricopeptide (TPR) repeat protein